MTLIKRFVKMLIAFFYKLKNLNKCKISATTDIIIRGCGFEGKNALGNHSRLSHTFLGYASYIGAFCDFSNCRVGRFSSVGNYVRVVSATHPLTMVSTYPAFYSDSYRVSFVKASGYEEHIFTDNGYECEIGNDVWIGDNVLIKGGIKIGDGSVIGMGSVVLKDVPPYTVVAGVPAKVIKSRFDTETVNKLLNIKWWDKPVDWIKSHAEDFEYPEKFLKKYDDKDNI